MGKRNRKVIAVLFSVALAIIVAVFIISVVETERYNKKVHTDNYTGNVLFRVEAEKVSDICA